VGFELINKMIFLSQLDKSDDILFLLCLVWFGF